MNKATIEKHLKAKDPFDLLLSDINMPGMDGLELLKLIKEDHLLGSLKIILITSEKEMNSVMKAVELGASDYIIKPVQFLDLKSRLAKYITFPK